MLHHLLPLLTLPGHPEWGERLVGKGPQSCCFNLLLIKLPLEVPQQLHHVFLCNGGGAGAAGGDVPFYPEKRKQKSRYYSVQLEDIMLKFPISD